MTKEELIELVKKIAAAHGTEDEIDQMITIFRKNVPGPKVTTLIFWTNLTPEEAVDKALAYRPIQL